MRSYQLIDKTNPRAKTVKTKVCVEKFTKLMMITPVSIKAKNITFTATRNFAVTPGSRIDLAIASCIVFINIDIKNPDIHQV